MKKASPSPPQLILRFFRWFCHPGLAKYIEGDLMEPYKNNLLASGKRVADLRFIADVVLLFRPSMIKPLQKNGFVNNPAMYKSYFRIGWRNLKKNQGYSMINIGGLAAGMAVAIMISLWVFDELTFNQNFSSYHRIAQVAQNQTFDGQIQTWGSQALQLGPELRTNYGNNFKHVIMNTWINDHKLTYKNTSLRKPGSFMEPGVTDMRASLMHMRIHPDLSAGEALKRIEAVFARYDPANPFEYRFLNEEYGKKFAGEKRVGKLALVFATLAILISCLGLFGLASFVAEQRTKEIGIRKVLGATVSQIWQLLSREFVVLVVAACIVSIPLAVTFMKQWLTQFPYRIDITWPIVATACAAALAITLITVSIHTIRAAVDNPVKSLRSE